MLSYRRETALQGAFQFSPKVEDWNWETMGELGATYADHLRLIGKRVVDLLLVLIC